MACMKDHLFSLNADPLEGILRKSGSCRRAQKAVIFDWEDPARAALLASSSETSRLCHHAGENRIAVPAAKPAAFTRAARRMGYILPSGS